MQLTSHIIITVRRTHKDKEEKWEKTTRQRGKIKEISWSAVTKSPNIGDLKGCHQEVTATLCIHTEANTCQRPTGQQLCFPYCWHVSGSCWLSGWDRGSWRDTTGPPQADLCCTHTHTQPHTHTPTQLLPQWWAQGLMGGLAGAWCLLPSLHWMRELLCRSGGGCNGKVEMMGGRGLFHLYFVDLHKISAHNN